MRNFILLIGLISLIGCGRTKSRGPMNLTIESVVNKGVVIDKGLHGSHEIVVMTENNIVREKVSFDVFNYVQIGDTIK